MRPTLNVCAGCLMKLSGSTYQQEVSQRVEFRAVSFPSFEAAAIERESLRAYISADQLCCSHIRLVRRQQLRLASERLQYWLRSVFRCRCSFVLLTKWCWDVSVKSQKSTIPHLCLQECFLTSSNLQTYFLVLRARDERKPYITGTGGIWAEIRM